jgi:hypothetical protein
MLSLKVFDRSHCEEMLDAYKRATLLILEALGRQAAAGAESDHADFRDRIAEAVARMSPQDARGQDVLISSGVVSEAVHEYNRHVIAAVRARRLELEAVVALLTETMAQVSSGSAKSLGRLKDIEHRLVKSEEIFDLRDLRRQMSECLDSVREEAACRRKESERLMADLRAAANPRLLKKEDTPPRPVKTGPGHDAIEEVIAAALARVPNLYVAVLAIDHLKPVAQRFGEAAALKVAAFCAQQAKASLGGEVRVWRGTACVALLDGVSGASTLERDIAHEATQRRTMTLATDGGREVLLHVTYSKWSLLPAQGRRPGAVVESMHQFLAAEHS